MSEILVENLTRNYGGGKGVFDVSFCVKKGEVFGFLGPNGAGKTTTIRHLMGFLKPEKGRCEVGSLDCWNHSPQVQESLGYIPGEINFFSDMSGMEFLSFLAKYRGMKTEGRMDELLKRFDLNVGGKLKKMSKGTKQKVGIVAAFMHDPDVLILDEPTSGLDPLMQARFIELVLEEKERGKTILMSSHLFEEVERTCHRVGIIKNGKIVADGEVDELKRAQQRKFVVTLESAETARLFAAEDGVEVVGISQSHVTVSVKNNIGELISVMNKYNVTNLSAPSQSLEEIFMHYYGGDEDV